MKRIGFFALLALASATFAQESLKESEPNDTRATADNYGAFEPIQGLSLGTRMNGVADGADVDRFRIFTSGRGEIQFDRFVLNRPTNTGGLYARSLTAAGTVDETSDVLIQGPRPWPSSTPDSTYNEFITVGGSGSSVDYGISGVGGGYQVRYSSYAYDANTPPDSFTPVATFYGGITIIAGSETIDSDIALIGSSSGGSGAAVRVLKANNDASATTRGSRISWNGFIPPTGSTFYLALAHENLVSGLLPDADEFARTPNDPRTHVFESSNTLAGSSLVSASIPLTIQDSLGNSYTSTPTLSNYGVAVYAFRMMPAPVPEPATLAALSFGALALLKRRREN